MSGQEYTQGAHRRIKCLHCRTVTYHELVHIHSPIAFANEEYDPDEFESYPDDAYENIYRLWICLGCKSAELEIVSRDVVPETMEPESFFYPQTSATKKVSRDFTNLDPKLLQLYSDAVKCYNTNAKIACAACLRALVEAIIVNLNIKVKSGEKNDLYHKIAALGDSGKIPEKTSVLLHTFRFMGNTALHELKEPYDMELQIAVEAMEQLIYYIYEAQYDLHERMESLASFRRKEIKKLYAQDNGSRDE